eukprot:CAMPEP_0177419120 /NCGR_PEP_ID=MMETSP0368-20130122/69542_1 /TAXON_ID=447022 ORGANISM="Scrippsiella hangoei-like, Strain SHHI-4" /NCGR_SAMPLE_ID=MMETSP0368 /ASSEMBLY_ACC=CAM_ASM_000363 /LENGTH=32 /DNA_ID= /DNA_START= /DNA_END= /DNA_ORIENTATION=
MSMDLHVLQEPGRDSPGKPNTALLPHVHLCML